MAASYSSTEYGEQAKEGVPFVSFGAPGCSLEHPVLVLEKLPEDGHSLPALPQFLPGPSLSRHATHPSCPVPPPYCSCCAPEQVQTPRYPLFHLCQQMHPRGCSCAGPVCCQQADSKEALPGRPVGSQVRFHTKALWSWRCPSADTHGEGNSWWQRPG